jgi:hypothetical protein
MDQNKDKETAGLHGRMTPWSIRNREKVMTLFLCLLVATIFWFINALSKDYTTTLTYPVEYVDLPRNNFITNNPPEKFNLKITTQGFTIVKYKLIMSFNPLVIPVSEILTMSAPSSTGSFVMATRNISDVVSRQLSMDVVLNEITPGVLSLAFDSMAVKHVPVASRAEFAFKPRYGLARQLTFEPSYVSVTGPRELVEDVDTLFTVPGTFTNVDADFRKRMALILPRNLYVEPDKVMLIAEVDEFTERTITLPVWIHNQPDSGRIRLFPREVEVSFKIGLSAYTRIKPEDFSLYVSWEDIDEKVSQLKVKVSKAPPVVNNLKIKPEYVEFLIERN